MRKSRYEYSKVAPKAARTSRDGIVFHSRTEMLRWQDLQLLERAGEIEELRRQVKFKLQPQGLQGSAAPVGPFAVMAGPMGCGKVAQYTPDFVYQENGLTVVEDVKGYPDENSKLRIRIFEAFYGMKVTIVRKVKGVGWVFE